LLTQRGSENPANLRPMSAGHTCSRAIHLLQKNISYFGLGSLKMFPFTIDHLQFTIEENPWPLSKVLSRLATMSAVTGSANKIRDAVHRVYSDAALHPENQHPFPMGRELACGIGYPPALIADLPSVAVNAFSGVSNVSIFADIPVGATVLDLGCGAGLDALIAMKRAGPTGRIVGLDFSDTMLSRARRAASECEANNVEFQKADAEKLPIENGAIDVALVNGIFNLNPAREAIFRELQRVLREGGALYAAELVLKAPLPVEIRNQETDWFAWIAGAKEGGAFLDEFREAGFSDVKMLGLTRNARTKNPLVLAAEVYARKP
jgi:arsenite methyltransferase